MANWQASLLMPTFNMGSANTGSAFILQREKTGARESPLEIGVIG